MNCGCLKKWFGTLSYIVNGLLLFLHVVVLTYQSSVITHVHLSVNKNMQSSLSSSMEILPTIGDGHCFLHAVIGSFKEQFPELPCPCLHALKCGIFTEIISNID